MGRVFIIFFLTTVLCFNGIARSHTEKGTVTVMARENLLERLPSSVVYIFPQFTDALIFREDGGFSEGRINVCLVDNSIRFVNEQSDTLLMVGYKSVTSFETGDSTYTKVGDLFVRQLAAFGKITLAERTKLELRQLSGTQSSSGGMVPPTSTAVKSSVSALDPSRKFEGKTEIEYTLTTDYILTDGDNSYVARPQSFYRFFPEKKKEIRAYIKENSVDFDSVSDLAELFMFCAEN